MGFEENGYDFLQVSRHIGHGYISSTYTEVSTIHIFYLLQSIDKVDLAMYVYKAVQIWKKKNTLNMHD